MARRQTKTAIPGDSSNPAPKPSMEADGLSKEGSGENKTQLELRPATLKEKHHGSREGLEPAAFTGQAVEQKPIPTGDKDEQGVVAVSSKASCPLEAQGEECVNLCMG